MAASSNKSQAHVAESCRCPRLASLRRPTFLQPLGGIIPLLAMLACWAQAVWKLLLGATIMVLVTKFAIRAQLLASSSHQMPLTKLGLGLGIACGLAG